VVLMQQQHKALATPLSETKYNCLQAVVLRTMRMQAIQQSRDCQDCRTSHSYELACND
jgi:hypothetical protein